MKFDFISHSDTNEKGIFEVTIDLNKLYLNSIDREAFEKRWVEFYKSDKDNFRIFNKGSNKLIYLSEGIIPEVYDERIPVVLLFGNPAPHSVANKMFYSYENNGREHRIWRVFREIGLINFSPKSEDIDLLTYNQSLKEKLYSLDYESSFRFAWLSFLSVPSTPSKPPWTGVAGVKKLFGQKAYKEIEKYEVNRINNHILEFIGDKKGAIIAFQKDAYENMRSDNSVGFSLDKVLNGKLKGVLKIDNNISIIGVPPTRFMQGIKAKNTLSGLINELRRNLC